MSDKPEKARIGVAMIARNAEDLIPTALEPLQEYVDEIAIVLGGISKDNTPEVAEKYATLPVEPFAGKVDEETGRLMHFGEARQQSFDILAREGIRYALVVDTDDQWLNADKLDIILQRMIEGKHQMVLFPYKYEGGEFIQPRIYDMETGHWEGPCHNYWEWDMDNPTGMHTDMMEIRQVRERVEGSARRLQNFKISDAWMAEHGDNARLLLHMAKDAMVERDFDRAADALDRYFPAFETDKKQDPEELYNAYHTRGALRIIRGRYEEALFDAIRALTVRPHAQSWTLASEAAGWLSANSREQRALLKMANFCADMALYTGRARGNLHWSAEKLTGLLPLFLKARALAGLGEMRDARGVLDLALVVAPDNEDCKRLRRDISRQLGEMD